MKLLPRQPSRPIRMDDNIGKGMDFALTTLLFLGVGYALDRWLGTRPIFMIVLFVLALVGNFARMWYSYGEKMAEHEAARERGAASRDR